MTRARRRRLRQLGSATIVMALVVSLCGCEDGSRRRSSGSAHAAGASISVNPPGVRDNPRVGATRTCWASYYGGGEALNRETANGEVFDPEARTAAHRKLRFGTKVRVTNLENGKSVTVRINDRGPADRLSERCIDLSRKASEVIGKGKPGTYPVEIEVLSKPKKKKA